MFWRVIMNEAILDDVLIEMSVEVNRDENFTKEFKEFTSETVLICKLCKIFEDGTGNKITKDNINNEKGVLNFIIATLPILETMNVKIKMEKEMINKLIYKFYLTMDDEMLRANNA
jgi:hypothetical protein